MPEDHGTLCRWDTLDSEADGIEYIASDAYHQLQLGPNSAPLSRNSVLLIPDLLSQEEMLVLLEAAERRAIEVGRDEHPKVRLTVFDRPGDHPALFRGAEGTVPGGLGEAAGTIWERMLNERVLPIIQRELPEAYHTMFGTAEACEHNCMRYLGAEPTVNRYQTGGMFAKHKDGMAMTVLCLLDDLGYEGGGTEYWAEEKDSCLWLANEDEVNEPATLRLHPKAGVGIVFHGQLLHAGAEVTAGKRYLLVGSFKT
jgi:hypothetical protein